MKETETVSVVGLFQAHHVRAVCVECSLVERLGQHIRGVLGGRDVLSLDRACV